ncbi:MAG: lysophospholipid acyltransferase family protein, partial [Anaerolineales bacterium]
MSKPYSVSPIVMFRRRLLRFTFRPIFRLLIRVRLTGLENIPLGEPYLIAANHISIFEPPFILAFWPEIPEAIAGHDVWERSGQGLLVKWYGALPVHRGEYDREIIKNMLGALRSGRPLLIFPEGGRSHTTGMRRAMPGVAYMVEKAGVPILPVAIKGTRYNALALLKKLKRPTFEMRIGKPFTVPPITEKGEARRVARQRNADTVM